MRTKSVLIPLQHRKRGPVLVQSSIQVTMVNTTDVCRRFALTLMTWLTLGQLAGSSALLGVPREVRDRIYDYHFQCDSEYPVQLLLQAHPTGHMIYLDPIGTFDSHPADKVLALLHVNHQISIEAACRFYGKRTFSGTPEDLSVFLRGIGQRRKLLRKVEIYSRTGNSEIYLTNLRDLLSDMSTLGALTLCQFRMAEDEHSYQSVYQSLIDSGIHKLGCELEVCNQRSCLRLELPPNSATRTTVRFSPVGRAPRILWSGKEGSCTALP